MLTANLKKTIALTLATVTFGLPILTNEAFAAAVDNRAPHKIERKADNRGTQHNGNSNHKIGRPQGNHRGNHQVSLPNNHVPNHNVGRPQGNHNGNHQASRPNNHTPNHNVDRPQGNHNNGHRINHKNNRPGNNHRIENRRPSEHVKHNPPRPVYRQHTPSRPVAHRSAPHPRNEHHHSSNGDWFGGLIIGAILGSIIANNNVDA